MAKYEPQVVKASEVTDAWGMNMILFGVPGVGKTTLAASAQDSPHGKNVLFIDVEGGTRSIADRADIDVIRPDSMGEVKEIYDWLADGTHDYRTIVVDTISELQRVGLGEILQTGNNPDWPQIQDWGKSTEQMLKFVRAFRYLAQNKGWNVIFTAHANQQADKISGAVLIRPNLTPGATVAVTGVVDVCGYMKLLPDGTRQLQLAPTRTVAAKYRQPLTGRRLPDVIDNPSMVDILGHLKGNKTLPDKKVSHEEVIVDVTDEG